jgi:glycosyltransferase involved in cell wall biosynthesis
MATALVAFSGYGREPDVSTPVVSVVITFLDTPAGFLEEAVASVEAQTFRDWELLLVNDGSGPQSTRLANAIAARSPERIRCIAHPDDVNRGIPASRNLGARHARGEFLAFLDSDDTWLPEKLEQQLDCLDRHPEAWMVFGRSIYWASWDPASATGRRDEVPALGVRDETLFRPPSFLHGFLRRHVLVPCPSSVLVRSSAFSAVGGFDESQPNTHEDQGFYTRIGLHGAVLAMDRIWVRYRVHPGSVIQQTDRGRLLGDRKRFLESVLRYTEQHGHLDRGFRLTVHVERVAAGIPGASRVIRFLRRAAALPARLSRSLRG